MKLLFYCLTICLLISCSNNYPKELVTVENTPKTKNDKPVFDAVKAAE